MALYLLDKNIVEDIKKSLKGVPTAGAAIARAVDRKGNTVSPLLSILEGSVQRSQSGPEFHDQMMADTQAVGMFYRLATTDTVYLQEFGASMVTALAPHMREKAGELLRLTMDLQALVVHQRTKEDARAVLRQIDALASEHAVNLSHPLVTCAVACLYGSGPARGVLKPAVNPTDAGAYNAVADIRLVMEAAYIRGMRKDHGTRENVRLYSGDKDLNALSRMLEVRVTSSLAVGEIGREIVGFASTISHILLPSLRAHPKEMERVLDHLRASRDGEQSIRA
ncbi:hypothetical protein [Paucibacter sp. DJ2R-2]|uniref:hypothetical protein n=1 Tax=Paucibacter sp. DJ2R-2 TaxID=2893558 RepID=UPI0021E44FAC|nr:hypothetical protein [Paucibacter sp. DJ2R-2]MCV2437178.1 hypothetical protein [Paucibacter sp. DJ2R-2]